jgi:hypothetical protein
MKGNRSTEKIRFLQEVIFNTICKDTPSITIGPCN